MESAVVLQSAGAIAIAVAGELEIAHAALNEEATAIDVLTEGENAHAAQGGAVFVLDALHVVGNALDALSAVENVSVVPRVAVSECVPPLAASAIVHDDSKIRGQSAWG